MSRAEAKNPTVAQSGLVAFQETWLHRTRFPASFSVVRNGLQGVSRAQAKNSYRGELGFRCKRLLQGLGCTERAPRLLSSGEGCFIGRLQHGHKNPSEKQGTGKKILPRRNRILGKWLFRRLTVGNTMKTLGFRNML